jgi:hypothetical protein
MTHSHDPRLANTNIHIWKHGELPMPDWLPQHMAGGIAKNGTLRLKTELGHARVNSGDVVIERCGTVWVRPIEEVPGFVDDLRKATSLGSTNVGPGKVRRFGITSGTRNGAKRARRKSTERRPQRFPPTGSQPSIEWLHLGRLSIDGSYQRSTDDAASRRLIASIAAKFDWRLCSPLVVSRRHDDSLVIIDGQHRWLAASKRDDIPQLPCCVFRYDSREEEARMFILANRARKPINRLDDYFAALAAADEDAIEIQQIVTDAGLRVARSTSSTAWSPGEISFTSSIATSIRRFGPAIAWAVLTDMAVAFAGQKLVHGSSIFGALVRIMSRSEPDFDPDRLVAALRTRTVEEWGTCVVGLSGGDSRVIALQGAIMDAYREENAD